MQSLRLCLLLVMASLLAAAHAQLQPRGAYLTNLPPAGEISTTWLLPTYSAKKFPAGKTVEIVVGVHNEGSETLNITMIAGSLNMPTDFKQYIQNFTEVGYLQTVEPGQQLSLEYKFYPDPRLPTDREFVVALTAFYMNSKGQGFSSTFFNQTVNIVEVPKAVDWELLFLILLFAVGLGAIGYFAYGYVVSLGWLKSQKQRTKARKPVKEGPVVMSAEDQQDWIKGTPYDSHLKRKVSTKKSLPAAAGSS